MAPEEVGLDKSSPYINVKLFNSFVLGYYIHLSKELGYVNLNDHCDLDEKFQETARVLQGLIRRIEKDSRAKG